MLPRSRTLLLALALCAPWQVHAADVKSAKMCNEELRENASAIKSSGISLRDFIHQCWRSKPGEPTPLIAQASKPSRIADNTEPAAAPPKPARQAAADVPPDQTRAQPAAKPAEIARPAQRTVHASVSNEPAAPRAKPTPHVASPSPHVARPAPHLARLAPPRPRFARSAHRTVAWRAATRHASTRHASIWRAAAWHRGSAPRRTRVAAHPDPASVILARSELGTLRVSGSEDTLAAGRFAALCLDSNVGRTSTCLSGRTGAITTTPLATAPHRRAAQTPSSGPPAELMQAVMLPQ